MAQYTLVSLDGQKIKNHLEYESIIVKAVFDNMSDEDDLVVAEDGFTTSLTPTEDELESINLQMGAHGFAVHRWEQLSIN